MFTRRRFLPYPVCHIHHNVYVCVHKTHSHTHAVWFLYIDNGCLSFTCMYVLHEHAQVCQLHVCAHAHMIATRTKMNAYMHTYMIVCTHLQHTRTKVHVHIMVERTEVQLQQLLARRAHQVHSNIRAVTRLLHSDLHVAHTFLRSCTGHTNRLNVQFSEEEIYLTSMGCPSCPLMLAETLDSSTARLSTEHV
jgi:hypothetical protein